ncbi:hypothetical protein niasHT_001070 [Heterodera trifolii]|uniref:HAT C-terminal dimerisation domain-containing protein n=1 Tax=Heterodera trifolii TaxID=157864 RepID=A0ABD2MBG0_9BILA
MNKFKCKMKERKEKQFYGILTGQLMRKLTINEANELTANFQNFLQTTLDYIDKWFRLERFPKSISWVGLEENEVRHADVLELASEIAPELEDKLFDEITDLNIILAELPNFLGISIEEKWKRVFRAQLPNLYVLISKVFAIPVSNAFVERVFSLSGTLASRQTLALVFLGTLASRQTLALVFSETSHTPGTYHKDRTELERNLHRSQGDEAFVEYDQRFLDILRTNLELVRDFVFVLLKLAEEKMDILLTSSEKQKAKKNEHLSMYN